MFTPEKQFEIGLNLERLAMAHGWKKMDEHTQMFFIEQMEGWNRSPNDIIQAIRKLFDAPMTSMNLPRIKEALELITNTHSNRLPSANDMRPMTAEEAKRFHDAIKEIKIKTMRDVK